MSTGFLNRDAYLKRRVIRRVSLDGGETVGIRALPASYLVNGTEDHARIFDTANLLVHSLCDEKGNLLFSGEEKEEVLSIDHLSLKTLLDAILDLNGLRAAPKGEAETPEKN